MIKSSILAVALFVGLGAATANASCQAFAPQLEEKYDLPPGLLRAILSVESKGTPWAVNTPDSSRFFKKKKDALNHIQNLKKSGCRHISVGCAQLYIPSHAHHFKTLGNLLDPAENIAYAARYLRQLKNRYGTWEKAVQRYNSGTNGRPYQTKVYRTWKQQQTKANARLVGVKQIVPKK